MITSLVLGGDDPTRLHLPVVPYAPRPRPAFLPPETSPDLPGFETLDAGNISGYGEVNRIERNVRERTTRVTATDSGGTRYPWGVGRYAETFVHEARDDRPADVSVRGEHTLIMELGDRTLTWEGALLFTSDLENFHYTYTRRLKQDGAVVREKTWTDVIPRDFQ
jgi:hypothetical protein